MATPILADTGCSTASAARPTTSSTPTTSASIRIARHDYVLERRCVDRRTTMRDPDGINPTRQDPRPRARGARQGAAPMPTRTARATTSASSAASTCVIGGTEGADTIFGDSGIDTLWGDGGNDRLEAATDVDDVFGGAGDDIITDSGDTGDVHPGRRGQRRDHQRRRPRLCCAATRQGLHRGRRRTPRRSSAAQATTSSSAATATTSCSATRATTGSKAATVSTPSRAKTRSCSSTARSSATT